MVVRVRLRAFLRFALLHLSGLAVIAYFGFHAYNGNYGITAQLQYDERKRDLQAELEDLTRKRQALEIRVALLRTDAIDPDLLEEKARRLLGLTHANDVVVFTDQQ
jgi:cell division protein FtsB